MLKTSNRIFIYLDETSERVGRTDRQTNTNGLTIKAVVRRRAWCEWALSVFK